MSLTNFTSFGSFTSQNWLATVSPLQPHHVSAVNNLLYGPIGHQQHDTDDPPGYYKNNPYSLPQQQSQQQQQQHQQQQQQYRFNSRPKTNNNYLPPHPSTNLHHPQQQQQHQQKQQTQQQTFSSTIIRNTQQQIQFNHNQQQQQNHSLQHDIENGSYLPVHLPTTKTINNNDDSIYDHSQQHQQQQQQQYLHDGYHNEQFNQQQQQLYPPSLSPLSNHRNQPDSTSIIDTINSNNNFGIPKIINNNEQGANLNRKVPMLPSSKISSSSLSSSSSVTPTTLPTSIPSNNDNDDDNIFPGKPPGFTRVTSGQGANTKVHAVLDYDIEDGEDYYDAEDEGTAIDQDDRTNMPTVTPIQGPIFLKNDTVPVVPLLSYPTVNNGTFIQIPIWWTALSVALGLDIGGDVIRGVPCIKRFHQLFCPTAGNSYPIEKIERFIDDNKALMRRMYGDFEVTNEYGPPKQQNRRVRRYLDDPDIFLPPGIIPDKNFNDDEIDETGDTYFGKLRKKRQNSSANNRNNKNNNNNNKNSQKNFNRDGARPKNAPNSPNDSSTGRVDACESKIEIVTPYWAANSAGKIRAIVNTQHFEQAIHQEICTKVQTSRCGNDCGCEQKYKWHRLLAYDPDNDCKGIFMDWFLFPSCCVCRCNP